jgi:hypothetical protein
MVRVISAAMLCAVLAACGGGRFTPAPTPTPTTSYYTCITSGPGPFTLISPAPGATGVPDTNVTLVFSGTPDTQYGPPSIVLKSASGQYVLMNFTQIATSEYSVTFGALQPATTFTVYYAVDTGESAPCNQLTLTLGSFTTQ